jgi:hypothetical protein
MRLNIEKLEKERKRLKLNRSAFSRHLGLHPSTYHKMVVSETTSIARMNEIAKTLDLDPRDLLV